MEIYFAELPAAATCACGVLLRKGSAAESSSQTATRRISRAKTLVAVWRLAPRTQRLEVRWTCDGAVPD
jgi:hypothetical protein